MKHGYLFLGAIVLIPARVLAQGLEAPSLLRSVTLKDAVRSALEKTEAVPIANARINQADARMGQYQSTYLPQIAVGARYERDDTGVRSVNGHYLRATLSQSVYEGGRDTAAIDASKFDKESQRQFLSSTSYDTFNAVAQSFYSILSNQRDAENLRSTIETAKARVTEINNRARIGRSRNIEQLAASAQVSVLEAQRAAAEGNLVIAWDQFFLLTGLPREIRLVEERERPQPPEDLETYLLRLEKRPDIAALRAQVEAATRRVDVSSAGHLPSLGIDGNYYFLHKGNQDVGNDWDIGASLRIPIFSGGLVRAQVREASEREREVELQLAQTRRQAEISVRTAYNSLLSAMGQITALESALKSTEQNYREQEKNYRFGQATNLDVIQALNTYQDTQRTLDRTRYQAFFAWAQLKSATAQVSLAQIPAENGDRQ